ncbi:MULTISPECIES: hypothetical protein [Rhizobium]|uniref:Uncharacterized protein n=1 Tax=Rhizobium favelukesii TaxID=348824 RepID=W6RWM4_9HYPH|nr:MULTISPECIES: hypothetical protein [Rhizobium]MCA0805241.1 hypothetical protein [Rhizobium sp. T1473]MCS0462541.1 hypothetical protein [Rhizobium favelukesii]UFS79427.1 hypothetical protein LPB79_07545 [Rhizobium sp. T136]CDM62993.1 hypothetical protein LPU83_pLPU83d_1623 [Rhizobium favelukesii]
MLTDAARISHIDDNVEIALFFKVGSFDESWSVDVCITNGAKNDARSRTFRPDHDACALGHLDREIAGICNRNGSWVLCEP